MNCIKVVGSIREGSMHEKLIVVTLAMSIINLIMTLKHPKL